MLMLVGEGGNKMDKKIYSRVSSQQKEDNNGIFSKEHGAKIKGNRIEEELFGCMGSHTLSENFWIKTLLE